MDHLGKPFFVIVCLWLVWKEEREPHHLALLLPKASKPRSHVVRMSPLLLFTPPPRTTPTQQQKPRPIQSPLSRTHSDPHSEGGRRRARWACLVVIETHRRIDSEGPKKKRNPRKFLSPLPCTHPPYPSLTHTGHSLLPNREGARAPGSES